MFCRGLPPTPFADRSKEEEGGKKRNEDLQQSFARDATRCCGKRGRGRGDRAYSILKFCCTNVSENPLARRMSTEERKKKRRKKMASHPELIQQMARAHFVKDQTSPGSNEFRWHSK